MILPIVVYGDPVLRKVGVEIAIDYPNLNTIILDMFATMYHAKGVGLAAPQIGKALRLFIVDTSPFAVVDEDEEDDEQEFTKAELMELANFKKVFINAKIVQEIGKEWKFNEGCLSIPKVREDVVRKDEITIEYQDENFKTYTETYKGLRARVIQHEYDHIEGKLFIDRISAIRRRLISGKLKDISNGNINADYKIKVYNPK